VAHLPFIYLMESRISQVVNTDIEKVLGLTRSNVELNGLSVDQRQGFGDH
jgi:hypothetical protein